jgi:hypothetical protein
LINSVNNKEKGKLIITTHKLPIIIFNFYRVIFKDISSEENIKNILETPHKLLNTKYKGLVYCEIYKEAPES